MNKKRNTILIIDDEPEIRGLLQEILTEEGYLPLVVKNAEEAQTSITDTHLIWFIWIFGCLRTMALLY